MWLRWSIGTACRCVLAITASSSNDKSQPSEVNRRVEWTKASGLIDSCRGMLRFSVGNHTYSASLVKSGDHVT